MKLALRLFVASAGLILFAWFAHRAGVTEIFHAFSMLGWLAPLVLLPFSIVYLFDTLGWRLAFGKNQPPAFPALMRVRWAGESVNSVFPSAYIAGEAVKVYLLGKRGVSSMIAAGSVVNAKTIQTLAQVVFITFGAIAGITVLSPGSGARYGMLAIAAAGSGIVVLLFWLQRHGMFSGLLALARKLRLRIPVLERNEVSLRQLDNQIANFYRSDRRHFLLSVLAYLGGWICDTLEILLFSHLVGMPLSWLEALAVESFIGVAKALGIFVPGSLGVQETGIVLLFRIFGLPEALGIPYAIVRRGREVIYALIGGAFLYAEEASIFALAKRARIEASVEA